MFHSWVAPLLPGSLRFHLDLAEHCAGRLAGPFTPVPAARSDALKPGPLRIHFWTPRPQFSAVIHVHRVVPPLREQASARGLPWQITSGDRLPETPVDWLICLKGIPPSKTCPMERTVLLIPDDADRVWGHLRRFGHLVSVTSHTLASFLGAMHPRVWFMEETESPEWIDSGCRALHRALPSSRPPLLLWHGTYKSLDGLRSLRPVLEMFARETPVELVVLTTTPARTETWDGLRVRYVEWSPEALAALAAEARLSIVPACSTPADSHLKNAGRLRRLFAAGCPAIGDSRVADVVEFSRRCGVPSAQIADEWIAALRQLWHDSTRLDEVARRGHELVCKHFSTDRTAAQWLWFFCAQGGK